jgi:predicted  nucleic acid-binding Zn-ribbon protein
MLDFTKFASVPTLGACTVLFLAGCSNSSARSDEQVQRTVQESIATLNAAVTEAVAITSTTGSDDPDRFRDVESRLTGIVSDLSGLNEAHGGQATARHMIAAQALRELASIRLEQASTLELEQSVARGVMNGQLGAIIRLDATADGLESINYDNARNDLDTARTSAEFVRDNLSQELATLDGPISDLRGANTEAAEKVAQLEVLANAKRREASDLGPVQGFSHFLEALRFEREADALDLDIASRQASLTYELEPVAQYTGQSIQNAQALLQRINQSTSRLAEYKSEAMAQAGALRDQLNDISASFNVTMKDANEVQTGTLAQRYEEASEFLERAAQQASQAIRGTKDAGSVRLENARIHELAGRVHWRRVQGLTQHLDLLERTATAKGTIESLADVTSAQSTLKAAAEANRAAADAALLACREMLDQVSGGDAMAIENLKSRVDTARSTLGGAAPSVSTDMGGSRGAPSSSGMADGSSGGDSDWANGTADEYMQALQSSADDLALAMALSERAIIDDPNVRRLAKIGNDVAKDLMALEEVLIRTFDSSGQVLAGVSTGMTAGMKARAVTGYTVVEVSENDAIYTVTLGTGAAVDLELVRKSDGWHHTVPAAMSGTIDSAQLDQMSQLMSAMSRSFASLRDRVNDGEFDTIGDFDRAAQAAMSSGAGG